MVKYKIIVNMPSMSLTFNVNSYEVIDKGFIRFLDLKSGSYRIYDSRICDIIEVKNNE